MSTPYFWDKRNSFLSKSLIPASWIYGFLGKSRQKIITPLSVPIPVICVGNLSVGGTGKTPVCLALGELLKSHNQSFFFLNHGYKSTLQNILIDPQKQTAFEVGDEAMLLAQSAPTIVATRRDKGAKLALEKKASLLIMDDGFQNPRLKKDISFVVIDGKKGFGNGRLIPAGPLREEILQGLKRASAIIISGKDTFGVEDYLCKNGVNVPIFKGHFELDFEKYHPFKDKEVLAFAGLANPHKFFDALTQVGIRLKATKIFPDHYYYTLFDIEKLIQEAGKLPLLTTDKDAVKLPSSVLKKVIPISGKFIFEDSETVYHFIEKAFKCHF